MTSTTSTVKTNTKTTPAQIELLPPTVTMRVGRRRLTLTWRPRKALPSLLTGLLQRSWRRVLAPALRVSVAAAAVCGAWQMPALAAAPAAGTLPTGWSVVNGNVTFTQNGNTLTIDQLSPQAIANFLSFSIGSGATVNINQPSAMAALLARVTGGDISQIYGQLTAKGTVVLYNPNGIVIGPGGSVDVNRFVATTLNITDADFLAGKYKFAASGAAGAVDNQGTIQSGTGGSVYLIGSSVSNSGIIRSPQGEVILGAGETVTIADTATPGVTVNVTGAAGNVTNLGTITADAGRIGVAAGLIVNSGNISASSVVREGGRIFLRATSNLTTTASSNISADGTSGGNVTLYSSGSAYIDGDVSATGSTGVGGFVETSGLSSLDVVKAPKVGVGGTWYIDPYDLTIVAEDNVSSDITSDTSNPVKVISSFGSGASISVATLNSYLNGGSSVVLATTGTTLNGEADGGNITLATGANLLFSNASATGVSLTLNADNNINLYGNITSTANPLTLNLNTNVHGYNQAGYSSVQLFDDATINTHGGNITVLNGSNGALASALVLNGGSTVNMSNGGTLSVTTLNISSSTDFKMGGYATINSSDLILSNAATLTANGSSSINAANVTVSTCSTLSMSQNASLSATNNLTVYSGGAISVNASNWQNGCSSVVNNASKFLVTGSAVNYGNITLNNVTNVTLNAFDNQQNLTVTSSNLTITGGLENNYNGTINTSGNTNITLNSDLNNHDGAYINFGNGDSSPGVTNITGTGRLFSDGGSITVGGRYSGEATVINSVGHTLNMTNTGGLVLKGNAKFELANTLANVTVSHLELLTQEMGEMGETWIQQAQLNIFGGNMTVTGTAVIDGEVNVSSNIFGAGKLTILGNTTGSGNLYLWMNQTEGGEGGGESFFSTNVIATPAVPSITLGNVSSTMSVDVDGGTLQLNGATRLNELKVESGLVNGATGSKLVVSESFQQTGGTLTLDSAALNTISEAGLTVGNITANNLVLESEIGAIRQTSGTSLRVKNQLIASAYDDINLGFSNITLGTEDSSTTNNIAAFAANSSHGGVFLVNHLNTDDTAMVKVNGINAYDQIKVVNYGGAQTIAIGTNADFLGTLPAALSGPESSAATKLNMLGINTIGALNTTSSGGGVSVATHSPLTIGSGGINSAGTITLAAGTSSGTGSALTINGVLVSVGNIALSAGDTMQINANISATPPGVVVTSVVSGAVIGYATGVTITDANGVVTPVPATVVTPSSEAQSATVVEIKKQQDRQAGDLGNTIKVVLNANTVPTFLTTGVTQQSSSNQTIGGTAGTFGDDGTGQVAKKTAMYCS